MKSGTRNIIICVACAAVLGGTVAVLSLNGGGKSSSGSSSSGASIELVSKKEEDVVSVKVANKKGSYTLLPIQAAAPSSSSASLASQDSASSSSASSSPSVTYTVQELGGCPIDTSETGSAVQSGFSPVASKNLGTVSNPADYGLQDPQATVKVTFKDGSSFNYKIGSVTAADSSAYYICGENSSDVYIASVDAGLLENAAYFVSKDLLTITNGDSAASADFSKLNLSGTNFTQPVKMEVTNNVLSIVSPLRCEADSSSLSSLESVLTSLSADSVEAVNPDADALKKYGFSNPKAVADYTVNKKSYKLTVGAQKGESYYVMLDGVNAVYNISSDKINSLAGLNTFGIRSKLLFVPLITSVKSIRFTNAGKTDTVDLTRTENAASSTPSKKNYNYKVAGDNGKALDYDKNYRNFYEKLIGISLLSADGKKPSGAPDITIRYGYFDKAGTDTIELYKTAARRYVAVINGEVFGTVVSDDADSVMQYLANLENGKAIPESY